MKAIRFENTLEKSDGKGGWHLVRVPGSVHVDLQEMSGKKGNVPVIVTIGKTTYLTTTMSMGEQQWFFGVKAEVRAIENVAEGDTVAVEIIPDVARLKKS